MATVVVFFFFQAEDGIRYIGVTGVQTCALPISQKLLAQRTVAYDIHLKVKAPILQVPHCFQEVGVPLYLQQVSGNHHARCPLLILATLYVLRGRYSDAHVDYGGRRSFGIYTLRYLPSSPPANGADKTGLLSFCLQKVVLDNIEAMSSDAPWNLGDIARHKRHGG